MARGPLFLPLSARGFLAFAITITVAPLAEVTPALMKALVSGHCDVEGPSVCFHLAGTVMLDGCCTFSLSGSLDGDGGTFSMPGSDVVEAPAPSLERDS